VISLVFKSRILLLAVIGAVDRGMKRTDCEGSKVRAARFEQQEAQEIAPFICKVPFLAQLSRVMMTTC
jgi:hypothetical protein